MNSHLSVLFSFVFFFCAANNSAQAIVHGAEVKTSQFTSVFLLEGSKSDFVRTYSAFCSGTLVHPKILITAAHCFDHGVDFVRVSQGKNPVGKNISRRIINGAAHPSWTTINNRIQRSGYDIGYIVLDKPIEASEVTPAELLPIEVSTFREFMQSQVLPVGFGIFTNFLPSADDDVESLTGFKHFSIQTLSQVTPRFLVTSGENGSLAPGDSGGGLFIEKDGAYKLIGVNSQILLNKSHTDRQSLFSVIRNETLCWIEKSTGEQFSDGHCTSL